MFFSKKSDKKTGATESKSLPAITRFFADPARLAVSSGAVVGATRFDLRVRCAGLQYSSIVSSLPALIQRSAAALPKSQAPSSDRDMHKSLTTVTQTADLRGLEATSLEQVAALFGVLHKDVRAGEERECLIRTLELSIHTDKMVFDLSSVAAALLEINRNPWGAADEYYKPKAEAFGQTTLHNPKAPDLMRVVYGFNVIEENLRLSQHFVWLIEASIAEIEAPGAK